MTHAARIPICVPAARIVAARLGAALLVAAALLPGCGTSPSPRPSQPPRPPPLDPLPVAQRWHRIGASVEGRPLWVAQSGTGRLRVYLIGGVHGDETEGRSILDALAGRADTRATIRILRDANPDGTAARRRTNARGYDLNRNWPARNFVAGGDGGPVPLSEPETRVLERDLRAFAPDLVVVLHSMAAGPLVNYDGPAERHAAAFAGAAQRVDPRWYVRPYMGYETSGSLGSYLGIDQQRPILTIELERGQEEASATAALRSGLAAVIAAAGDTDQRGGR